jgi:hypothetical protein
MTAHAVFKTKLNMHKMADDIPIFAKFDYCECYTDSQFVMFCRLILFAAEIQIHPSRLRKKG